jgi:hypothetical protein
VGGFYELSIEVGTRDDGRLARAVDALWRAAGIYGCCADRTREPADQEAVPLTVGSVSTSGHLYGRLTLPGGAVSVCGALAIRMDDGTDWLNLYLPMGALARTDPRVGGFPFGAEGGPSSLSWRGPLDAWLADVGAQVYREVDFRRAIIGFETDDAEIAAANGAVSQRRSFGYLLPRGDQVHHHSANV